VISSVIVSRYCIVGLSLLLVTGGCTFRPPNLEPGNPDAPDARPADDGGVDARPDVPPDASPACAGDEVRLELRIGGAAATEGNGPYAQVLLGDLVEISAAGSCAGAGEVSYEWSLSPAEGIEATAEPALADDPEVFSVYPTAAGDYQVTLTVRAPSGASQTRSVAAIRAHAWQEADVDSGLNMGTVRDMSVGRGNLWIAAGGGPYALPLAGPTNAFARVQHSGDQVGNDLQVVLFDARTDFLWFGRRPNDDGLYRLNMAVAPVESQKIEFNGVDALDGDAETRDIVAHGTNTIVITTNQGITAVDGSEPEFSGRIQPDGQNPEALAFPRGRRLAGSRRLYDLDTSSVYDLGVGGMDNKIRAMAAHEADEVLWIGTDGEGVVTFDLRTNTVLERYTDQDDLESDIVRALLVESEGPHAGDVWIATSDGVARYISRRQTWLDMDEDQGLGGNQDLAAIAIDTSENRRVLYAGSSSGVVYIRVP
jgi:hypothetical protein